MLWDFGMDNLFDVSGKMADLNNYFRPHPEMLLEKDIHPLQRERFIQTGYRQPHKPWSYYVKSLLMFHSETFNVWTHVVGAMMAAYYTCQYADAYTKYNNSVVLMYGVVTTLTQCFSAIAHCFCSRSPLCHRRFFIFDYMGVGLFGFCNHATLFMTSYDTRWLKMVGKFGLPFAIFVGTSTAFSLCFGGSYGKRSTWLKRVVNFTPNALSTLCGITPLFTRIYFQLSSRDGACADCTMEDEILFLHFVHCCSFFVMGFFFMTHIPERFVRRKCDVIGGSHQLFHICITFTMLTTMKAVYLDIKYGYRTQAEVDVLNTYGSVWWAFGVTLFMNVCFMAYFMTRVKIPPLKTE